MPITTKHGSIFDSSAQVLVCPVNCVGVMGKGLALEFKKRFPKEAEYYFDACRAGVLSPGCLYPIGHILFVATKMHWKYPSQLEWVDDCLARIREWQKGYTSSITIPQLGCGCGGLDWADVEPLYHKHLGDLPVDVEVWVWP